jgi:selenocysteine lyase/cysteine desulfurase
MPGPSLDRREFARLFTLGGSAALLGHPLAQGFRPSPLAAASLRPGAVDWASVREQFLMPPGVSVLNAANLCPSPAAVLQTMYDLTERLDRDPVPTFRDEMHGAKERAREDLARYFRVAADDILVTRNTSEGNNWVSSGLDLGPGDEVVIFSDNHPSNNQAWKAKAERFGFSVREVHQVNPHPGFEYYLEAFERALTPGTRVLAFTHLTNTAGDLFPAEELCDMARRRGVVSLVDGAQSFGLLDVDLSRIQPDFFTGSAHKWPCGPKENGVLYVNPRVQERFWPSIYSAYVGRTGLSRTHEGLGQRDEPAVEAFGTCIRFLESIGQAEIEARSRELTVALVEGLTSIPGVRLWTSSDPRLRAAVVSFDPAGLDPRKVVSALEAVGIVATARSGEDRRGVRFAPHFYNSFEDVERAVAAIGRLVRSGV